MTDDIQQINEAVQRAWDKGRDIGDALARRIAQHLSDGVGPLHDFAETGAISPDLEIVLAALGEERPGPHDIWRAALDEYCRHHGRRGPVAGWSNEPRSVNGGPMSGGDDDGRATSHGAGR